MKIVISGGTGFLGQALVESLKAEGHHVTVITRHTPPKDQTDVVFWSGRYDAALCETVATCDAVIHLAGEPIFGKRWTDIQKEKIRHSRILGTQAITMALLHRPASSGRCQFLCASAVGYYGDCFQNVVSETTPKGQDFLSDVCEKWESAALGAAHPNINVIRLRFGSILGPGGMLGLLKPLFNLYLGGFPGPGTQWVSWVHRRDAIRAISFLLASPEITGPVNIVSPNPVQMESFCRQLAQFLKKPCWAKVPAFILRLVFQELSTVVLNSCKAKPDVLTRYHFTFQYPELDQALLHLEA